MSLFNTKSESVFFCTLKRPNSKIFLNFWYYYNWSRFLFSCCTFDSPCGGMKTIRQTHTTKAHLEGTFSVFLPKLISLYIQKLLEKSGCMLFLLLFSIQIMPLHFLCSKLVLHSAPKVKYFVQKVYFNLMQSSKKLLKKLLGLSTQNKINRSKKVFWNQWKKLIIFWTKFYILVYCAALF